MNLSPVAAINEKLSNLVSIVAFFYVEGVVRQPNIEVLGHWQFYSLERFAASHDRRDRDDLVRCTGRIRIAQAAKHSFIDDLYFLKD